MGSIAEKKGQDREGLVEYPRSLGGDTQWRQSRQVEGGLTLKRTWEP